MRVRTRRNLLANAAHRPSVKVGARVNCLATVMDGDGSGSVQISPATILGLMKISSSTRSESLCLDLKNMPRIGTA